MDYKKKYEQALERARQVHTTNVDENKKSTEYIFPELKESEDERIRKAIINFLSTPFVKKGMSEGALSTWIAWLEKQSEQKPADEVKPKFKVGDWVIDKQNTVHKIANVIENVTSHTYGYDIVGGGYFNDNTEGVRRWTIHDAKDGDVLYTSSTASHEIFIFKGLTKEGYIECYCSYDSEDKYCDGKYHFIGKPTFMTHPATKEQCDLLFSKMKEAGYE